MNDLIAKVDYLGVCGKLRIVPIDLKKLSDILSKVAVHKTVYNTLKKKAINLEKKFLMPLL